MTVIAPDRPPFPAGAHEVCYRLGARAVDVDAGARLLQLDDGSRVSYGSLVLAPGGTDLQPSITRSLVDPAVARAGLVASWDREDGRRAAARAAAMGSGRASVAVLGTGVAAVEAATSLTHPRFSSRAKKTVRTDAAAGRLDDLDDGDAPAPSRDLGCSVTLLLPEPAPMSRLLPRYLSSHVAKLLRSSGVQLETFASLQNVGPAAVGRLQDGRPEDAASPWRPRCDVRRVSSFDTLKATSGAADLLVLAPGRLPARTALATGAAGNGIGVDAAEGGLVAASDLVVGEGVSAAGRAASVPSAGGGRARDQTKEGCFLSGWAAGANMARRGSPVPEARLCLPPAWESDLPALGVRLLGVGEVDSQHETYGYWQASQRDGRRGKPGFRTGVLFYVRRDRVVGGLVWRRVPRRTPSDVIGRWGRGGGVREAEAGPAAESLLGRSYDAAVAGRDPVLEASDDVSAVSTGRSRAAASVLHHLIAATAETPLQDDAEMRALLEQAAEIVLGAAGRERGGAAERGPAHDRHESGLLARSGAGPVRDAPPRATSSGAGTARVGAEAEASAVGVALAGASSLAPVMFFDGDERWRRISDMDDDDAVSAAARLRAKGEMAASRGKGTASGSGQVGQAEAAAAAAGGRVGVAPSASASAAAARLVSPGRSSADGHEAEAGPGPASNADEEEAADDGADTGGGAPSFAATRNPSAPSAAQGRQRAAAAARLGAGDAPPGARKADKARLHLRWTQPRGGRVPDGGIDVLVPAANRSSQSRREAQASVLAGLWVN